MAEDNWDVREKVRKSLADLTASQYLLSYSDYNLISDIAADTSKKTLRGGFTLAPRDDSLPSARLSAEGGVNQRPSATLSLSIPVGRQLIDYERRWEKESSKRGGPITTDTVSGKAGPFSAFYSETGQPGNQGLEQTSYGGRMSIGPAKLFARRIRSRQDVVDPRYAGVFPNTGQDTEIDTIGARGSLPLGPGTLSGDISRQFETRRFPQHISQESRPMAQDSSVDVGAGWSGKAGPGILAMRGDWRRGEPSLRGSYTIQDPLGLGGQFRAKGSYVNPLDPSRRSAAEAMLRYKLRF